MFLKFIAIVVILTVGIYAIAYLEEILVSGPRRKMLEQKAREKLKKSEPTE
jgi:hypothetical protein